jgi:nucleoside-diphosphate-sugar epimerase
VANAAHGIVVSAERGRPGEVYLVTDGPPSEFREFVTRYLATAGVKAPDRGMSSRGGRMLSRVEEGIWGLIGANKAPAFSRAMFATIGAECTFIDRKARDELGYEPVVDPERAMTELAEARARANSKGRSARP